MIVYRCDICGKETFTFRSLTFKRSEISHGQIVAPEAVKSLDVCSDLCELQAASDLLRRLSKASSVGEDGRPFRSHNSEPDPGPDPATPRGRTWDEFSNHRR